MVVASMTSRPDRRRSEAIQYTLIASMISVSAFAVMASIGIKILAHWTNAPS